MSPPPAKGEPDGSSLKPVSSLRSHFESMGKTDDPPPAPRQQPQATGRTVSPGPPSKPDRLRDPAAIHKAPPAIPKNKPGLVAPPPRENGAPRSPVRNAFPAPPLTPRPIQPPELLVDPPQSPPKRRSLNIAVNDQPSLLVADDIVKHTSPAVPANQFKIPSRPHTPAVDPRRSPRLLATKPPSPPPPRRSAELRRQREFETGPPLPINRADKPLINSSRNSCMPNGNQALDARNYAPEKVSPFNSPPNSGSASADEESPPELPSRSRPQQREAVARPKTVQHGFEPPPVHHSVAGRRREMEVETSVTSIRGQLTPDLTGEPRPNRRNLPTRPQSTILEKSSTRYETMPPPRPPRPGIITSNVTVSSSASQKRTVSTPVTHHPPPPQRTMHGRSNTVSHRAAERPQNNNRMSMVVSTTAEHRGTEFSVTPSPRTADPTGNVNTTFPDSSSTNRRPPYIKHGVHEVHAKYDARAFDICGDLVCTIGHLTRVWSILDGELLMSFAHGEGLRASAVSFKPGVNVDEEGKRLWIGNNSGDLMEADIATQSLVVTRPGAHGRNEVIRIYRHFNELWTLDDVGTLHVWGPGADSVPDMSSHPDQSFRVPKGHSFSLVVGDELWYATGKEIRVFLPTLDGQAQFQAFNRSLGQEGAGEITSGTLLTSDADKVFFGHVDGKISIYSRKDYSCLQLLTISTYKINSLQGLGDYMWAGFNTGKVCVYDMRQIPWVVKKDWQAHDNPVIKLFADPSSSYRLDRHQVISLGADQMVRAWDGLLQEDWLEGEMKAKDVEYCEFQDLKTLVMTWNAGACTPNSLRYSDSDAGFFQNLLQSNSSPDILIFGFQELVDLEDKTATAKRFLKPKKKDHADQERMSHQYRDWRDFLVRSLDDYVSGDLYHLLQTSHMVGLFTCIFVKADIRDRISKLSASEVKRGMGGLHGNKGAIVVRFAVDDTSLCFVNCHLAAGQSQAQHRHNDIAAILEAQILPIERDPSVRVDSFVGGGDGTMVLDHELCIVNGDLNYRIDTMSRDTVVMAVKQGNLGKLLDRDQLLVARRRNPGFKLRAFEEMPITFAPTYKYDVGTDNYDSSEKKRSPAWCDRLLYRGRGRIQQLEYKRHEVRVSDHRPVTGKFKLTVKKISPKKRATAWMECQQQFEDMKDGEVTQEKLYYLTQIIGYDLATSKGLLKDRPTRRDHRSPSRG